MERCAEKTFDLDDVKMKGSRIGHDLAAQLHEGLLRIEQLKQREAPAPIALVCEGEGFVCERDDLPFKPVYGRARVEHLLVNVE